MTADDAAWLVRYAGQAIGANYGQTNTGATSTAIPTTFVNVFGFGKNALNIYRNVYNSSDWDDLLYNELSNGRPFILNGQVGNDVTNGHSFICHGYSQGYYAVNWGWGGMDNGYFAMEAMIGGGINYSSELVACVNLSPSGGSITPGSPFSLTKIEVVGSNQYYRSSTSQPFSNLSCSWKVRNALVQDGKYQFALFINMPDNNWVELYHTQVIDCTPINNISSEASFNIGSQFGDGTYRITVLYLSLIHI